MIEHSNLDQLYSIHISRYPTQSPTYLIYFQREEYTKKFVLKIKKINYYRSCYN